MNYLTQEQCVEQCLGVFLQFVHDDYLWAFAPNKFMRWSPALWPPKKEEKGLWKPIPFVWDFGSRVLVPEFWAIWLDHIVNGPKKVKKEPDSVFVETDIFIKGRLEGNERKTLSVTSDEIFRGENIVFLPVDAFGRVCDGFICVWGFSVNGNQQMKLRKGNDGVEQSWWSSDFFEEVRPANLRLDTCVPGGTMSIDLENAHDKPVDVMVKVSGSRLVKKTT